MKLSTTRENLLQAIQTLTAIPKRTAFPVLQSILVRIDREDYVSLHATDLETYQSILLPCWSITAGTGKALLDPKSLTKILKALPKETQVDLSWDNEKHLTVFSLTPDYKTSQITITLEADPIVYPVQKTLKYPTQRISVPLEWLTAQAKTTLSYASMDELRPQICGVFFEIDPEKLLLTATNGHILHHVETTAQTSFNDAKTSYSFIVGGKSLSQFISGANKVPQKYRAEFVHIWVSFREDKPEAVELIEFSCGDFFHVAKAVEGRYPNYRAIIPATPETGTLYTDPRDINHAISSALPICCEVNPSIRLSLNGSVILKVENISDGKFSDCELSSCQWVRHNPDNVLCTDQFDIGFNPHYVKTILNSFDADRILFDMYEPRSCVVVRTPANPDRFSLLMPVEL